MKKSMFIYCSNEKQTMKNKKNTHMENDPGFYAV